jgi:hypothetical protein
MNEFQIWRTNRTGIHRCLVVATRATLLLGSTSWKSTTFWDATSLVAAEKALGAKFNIRAFHDAVLELGSVPLPVVTARIDRFIAEGGKGPYPDME